MKRFRSTAAVLGLVALCSGISPALIGAAPSRLARFNNGGDGGGAGGGTGGGTGGSGGGGNAGGGSGGADNGPTLAQLQSQLASLQSTVGTLTKERDELAGKVKTFEDNGKSETEKLTGKITEAEKKLADAESRAKRISVQIAVERAARKKGVVDEDAAYRLLDTSRVEYEADGITPKNVDALLDELLKAKTWLVGQSGGSDGGNSGGNGGTTGGGTSNPARPKGTLTKDDIKKMSTKEINERWEEVQKVLAS